MPTFSVIHIKHLLGMLLSTTILIGIISQREMVNQHPYRRYYPRTTPHNFDGTSQSNVYLMGAKSTDLPSPGILIEQPSTSFDKHCPTAENSGRWHKVSHLCYVYSAYLDKRPVCIIVLHIVLNINIFTHQSFTGTVCLVQHIPVLLFIFLLLLP